MRIIGGRLRGLRLAEVGAGDRAAHLRPTADRVREAMFNLLTHGAAGDRVTGARVLDLFAGTGALAFEALSRGAASALIVDNGRAAAALIARNIALTRTGDAAQFLARDATRPGPCPGPAADLVFLDPPYGADLGLPALRAVLAEGWIAPGAVVVWEDSRPGTPPPGLVLRDCRRYGESWITLCEAA